MYPALGVTPAQLLALLLAYLRAAGLLPRPVVPDNDDNGGFASAGDMRFAAHQYIETLSLSPMEKQQRHALADVACTSASLGKLVFLS